MGVKSRRYRQMLEQETRKKQPLMKAQKKAAAKAGGLGSGVDKYDRPSRLDRIILAILRARKKGQKNGKESS